VPADQQAVAQVMAEIRDLAARIKSHNANPPDRTNRAAVEAYNAEARRLNAEVQRLRAKLQRLLKK
jgi:uncharacterized protein YukE